MLDLFHSELNRKLEFQESRLNDLPNYDQVEFDDLHHTIQWLNFFRKLAENLRLFTAYWWSSTDRRTRLWIGFVEPEICEC